MRINENGGFIKVYYSPNHNNQYLLCGQNDIAKQKMKYSVEICSFECMLSQTTLSKIWTLTHERPERTATWLMYNMKKITFSPLCRIWLHNNISITSSQKYSKNYTCKKQWASSWENLANAYENSDGKDWLIGQRIQDYQRGSLCLTDRFSPTLLSMPRKVSLCDIIPSDQI